MADPLRQAAVSVGKNAHFSRELDPFPPIHLAGGGGRREEKILDCREAFLRFPRSITAHAPGYIDRENEIIVGLQTDAPLKRAIMPNGGQVPCLSAGKGKGTGTELVRVAEEVPFRPGNPKSE